MLEEVDPLEVVEVADAVGHAVLGDDDGDGLPVLLPQPVDHLADGEGRHLQPARPGGVPLIMAPSINDLFTEGGGAKELSNFGINSTGIASCIGT